VGWAGRAAYFAAGHKSSPVAAHGAADGAIRAPMTGKVVAVRVKPGHQVEAGDLLVVLEAMKMEYRLAAPRPGTVGEVHCQEGELVDLGKTLVTLAE
jgi:biotin carboxyl carrier protein